MSENDTETYFNRFRITLLRVGNESVTVKAYRYEKEKLWAKEDAVNLKIGENLSTGDYLIRVIDFDNNSVNLSIYKDSIHLASDRFDIHDSHIYAKELKMCVKYLDDDHCTLETYRALSPDLSLSINTEDIYSPDQTIHCSVSIKNNGILIRNALLDIQVGEQRFVMHYPVIDSNITFNVTIDPPVLPYQSNLSITASVNGRIWNGNLYSINCTRDIIITPYIMVEKSVTPVELNISESAIVTITVRNLGIERTDIRLTDTVPDGFETDILTGWAFQIASNQSRNITYPMSSKDVGRFEIPGCTAEYDGYAASSLPCSVAVHGPAITAAKMMLDTLDCRTMKVVLHIENRGDRAADIEVIDEIPAGVAVISGDTNWQARILPEEVYNHSYIIQSEGINSLPPALIRFTDDNGNYYGTVESNPVAVEENATITIPATPVQTPAAIGSGELAILLVQIFILFGCIFSIPIIGGYLLLRNQEEQI
ncbi:MAG: hypothetical protein GWP10_17125 [Nitrospiraceae bacterium]|nr:hypothetical protein [Nitrospiraceae bacterium]